MKTIVAPQSTEKTKIQKIAFSTVEKLREGQVIALAVENSYVAIVDPTSDQGLIDFKSLKDHEEDTFYPVFVSTLEDLSGFVGPISSTEKLLASSFWPGLLNLEFKANRVMPHNLGAENAPSSLVARKPKSLLMNAISDLIGPVIYTTLLKEDGKPVKLLSELSPRIKKVISLGINSGEIKSHKKTTLISCRESTPRVVREGSVPSWKIKKVVTSLLEF